MKINIRTIPHDKQRYETCGDYWTDSEGRIKIVVSDNQKFENYLPDAYMSVF